MRIADDLFRYEGKKSKKLSVKLRYFFFTPGFTFTFFFRKASCSKFLFSKMFWTVCFHFTKFVTGIQIPIGTQIGKGLKLGILALLSLIQTQLLATTSTSPKGA